MLSSPQLEQQEPPAPAFLTHPAPSPRPDPALPTSGGCGDRNRGLRFGLNAWVETGAERSRQRALLRSVTPEARAMRRALNTWAAVVAGRLALRRGVAAFAMRGLHDAMNAWVEAAADRAAALWLMGRAAASFADQGLRTAMNTWVENADELAYRRGLLSGLVSPAARAMRRGLNSWFAMVDQRAMMRRAGSGFRNRELKAAYNKWAATATERAAALSLLGRAGAAVRNRGLRFGFNAWAAMATARAAKVSLMRKPPPPSATRPPRRLE